MCAAARKTKSRESNSRTPSDPVARLEASEGTLRIANELSALNESLQALAYAALGQHGPNVRRRRTG